MFYFISQLHNYVSSLFNRNKLSVDSSGRAVLGMGLRSLAYWDCGFETRRGHGGLSLVSVV
jgi:hypothetical protein